jgi:hypothetical protein
MLWLINVFLWSGIDFYGDDTRFDGISCIFFKGLATTNRHMDQKKNTSTQHYQAGETLLSNPTLGWEQITFENMMASVIPDISVQTWAAAILLSTQIDAGNDYIRFTRNQAKTTTEVQKSN